MIGSATACVNRFVAAFVVARLGVLAVDDSVRCCGNSVDVGWKLADPLERQCSAESEEKSLKIRRLFSQRLLDMKIGLGEQTSCNKPLRALAHGRMYTVLQLCEVLFQFRDLWDVLHTHLALVRQLELCETSLSLSHKIIRHLRRFLEPVLVLVRILDLVLSEASSWILVTSLDRNLAATLPERASCGLFAAAILPCWPFPAVGDALSYQLEVRSFPVWFRSVQCCVDHPSRCSGPQASLPLRSPVTVTFTLSAGFMQVLVENAVDCSLFSSAQSCVHPPASLLASASVSLRERRTHTTCAM